MIRMVEPRGVEPLKRLHLFDLLFFKCFQHIQTRLTRVDVVTIVVTTMASLRKHPRSPFLFACFTLPDGRRTQRSTGATDRKQAQRIANQFEDAARAAAQGRFIESRARKAIADIYALANVDTLPGSTVSRFYRGMVETQGT